MRSSRWETELARTEQRLHTYRLEFERTRSERNEKEIVLAKKRDQAEVLEQKRQGWKMNSKRAGAARVLEGRAGCGGPERV